MLMINLVLIELVVAQRFIISVEWDHIKARFAWSPISRMLATMSPLVTAEICVNASALVVNFVAQALKEVLDFYLAGYGAVSSAVAEENDQQWL